MNKEYVIYLNNGRKSENTIKVYTKYVQQMLDYIGKDEKEITWEDLMKWQSSLSNLSSSSVHLQTAAVKSYFNFLMRLGVIEKNPTAFLEVPKVKNKEKPFITKQMVSDMVDACRTMRDKAIILTFCTTGMRVSELANITVEQYRCMGGDDGRELIITGKGDKQRTVYINDETKQAIDMYLATNPKGDSPWLFKSFQGNQIHANSLSQTIKSTAKRAGIPFWNELSNHCMRAAFATIASDNGIPVPVISQAMGHTSINTTNVYIKRHQNQINNAMKSMTF